MLKCDKELLQTVRTYEIEGIALGVIGMQLATCANAGSMETEMQIMREIRPEEGL
jgi:hypothetical protein